MEQQRNILFVLFLVLSLFLYWSWESDKLNEAKMAQQQAMEQELIAKGLVNDTVPTGNTIRLVSDALDLTISLTGGDVIDAKLPLVKQELNKDDPFHLLMNDRKFVYISQSGLAGKDGIDSRVRPTYTSTKDVYTLEEGKDSVSAVLHYTKDNVTYKKIYTIYRAITDTNNPKNIAPNAYVINVEYDISNKSDKNLSMAFYGQLKQTVELDTTSGAFGMVAGAYRGSAYSTDSTRYEKNTFADIVELANDGQNINVETKGGWIAMIQHYFVSAWIGDTNNNIKNVIYTSKASDGKEAIIGIRTIAHTIEAGTDYKFNASMWLGPKNQDNMEILAPNLDLTVDYGWLWFISIPLFKILEFIQSFIGNWGFSIIILTLVVRTVLFPLTKAQYTSMAKMRLLTPKMQELRERYKDDKQKLGQETMRLYKTEKVNPLGGCLPLIIQMPIFIALYWTLMESTELRHAPFILWIKDLSVYDPYFVTPILYGITMFMIQKMSPTPVTDPIQKKVLMAMPLVFTFMFCTFPAGLTIYWLISNIFTILQQVIIFKSLEKRGLHVREGKKS